MATPLEYEGQDLRGESFRGKDLDGANFTEADLRGADFSNSSLVEAKFINARLGVRPLAASVILGSALMVSIAAGVAIGLFAEATREQMTSSDWRDILAGLLLAGAIAVFLALFFTRGVSTASRAFVITIVVIVLLDFAVVFVLAGEIRFRNAVPLIGLLVLFVPAATAGVLGRIVGSSFGAWAIGFVAAAGGAAAGRAHGGAAAVVVSVVLIIISRRALKGDLRDRPMRYVGHRIVTHWGTRFTTADVSRADFTGAATHQSDLFDAVLDGAVWEDGQVPLTRDVPTA
jgi:hypothetical protein